MNEASRWRLALARQIAPGYTENAKVAAVVVAGSVGRSQADRFSDIEIDVYWHKPPLDDDRLRPIARVGGDIKIFWPYSPEEEEWGEEYTVNGVSIGISSFLVSTVERWLVNVVEEGDGSILKQMRLAAIEHSIPLLGAELVMQWRRRAAAYPEKLARLMVEQHLSEDAFGGWYKRYMLMERDDLLLLYDVFVRMGRNILGALLGLNHIYLANPAFKWLDETVAEMAIAPPGLSIRLKQVLRLEPVEAIRQLEALLAETVSLVETQLPALDMTAVRTALAAQRPALEAMHLPA